MPQPIEQCKHTFTILDRECIVCNGQNKSCPRYISNKPAAADKEK